MTKAQPQVGIVSLGCPKALVDSERILTKLRADGYGISGTYAGADVVIVNTCGFLDSAKAESLEAIGEAIAENGRVIVTGCLGADAQLIRDAHPDVLAVSGPHQYEAVVAAVHDAQPPAADPFADLVPPEGIRLTPRHYAYLKIAEGCNQRCAFCIIPSMRGDLVSRPANEIVAEAERLARAGVQELLVVSQDTGAYGTDLKYAESTYQGKTVAARITDLCQALGDYGMWVRLHYIYPYPHIDDLIPLMAAGVVLPYLDIPFQHAAPEVLKAMRRPAHQDRTLGRIHKWRDVCPDLAIRSTFIVGFPGETEAQFSELLQWLEAAELDRVGCFKYEDVAGAAANGLPGHIDEDEKDERWERLMETQRRISARRTQARIGRTYDVLIDEADADGAIGRTYADAPEIDGVVHVKGVSGLAPGDRLAVTITGADDYDLIGRPAGTDA
ncbi:MAG: 30S ribosomal protein S12 methylthiotransferase RimO [Rhodospirillaceae bacterium]